MVRRIVDRRQIFDRNAPDARKVLETLQFVEFDDGMLERVRADGEL
jgi:hypothetical protein